MKLIFLFFLLFFMSCVFEGKSVQNKLYPDLSEIGRDKLAMDSTKMEYFDSEPEVIFKPTIPDSLKPINKTVKITVRVELDSSGKPLNSNIIKTTDKRFNDLALKFALKYRFKPVNKNPSRKQNFVIIPIILSRKK